MSIKFEELQERAENGELTEADVAYINAREGLPRFDMLREAADDAEFDDDEDGEDDTGYDSWKVAELAEEVAKRNEDRDEEDVIEPESGKKADLIAALEADDEETD